MAPCTTWGARLPRTLRGSWRRERDVLIRFAPSASLRSPNQFPSQGRGRFSSLITKITILNTDALNYVEFRPAMHPTWCMAEREGFEPSIPLLAGYTISNRAPSASSGISPTLSVSSLNQLQPLSNNSALSAFAEREGCARSLRSLRLPSVAEPSVPILFGTHDFQSCPFGLSGISPFF